LIGGTAVTTDILGNRLVYGSSTYSWDALNRLTSLAKSGSTTNYEYRADGMRTHKSNGSTFTEYFHDAQMSMEDSAVNGSNLTVTRYGLGARGIDYEEVATGTYTNSTTRSVGNFTNVGFPIYDAHGNMVATLARFGSTFTLNNKRSFDAWGQIRNGAQTGDPKNRYCGSLGHQHDDESGLIYMCARYYEPGSGRFVNEDPSTQGTNFFVYSGNKPTSYVDKSGKTYIAEMDDLMVQLEGLMLSSTPPDIFTWRVAQLMQAMGVYIGLARSDADRYEIAAGAASASGNAEAARTFQALAGESRAEAIVGVIYEGQMALAILMRESQYDGF